MGDAVLVVARAGDLEPERAVERPQVGLGRERHRHGAEDGVDAPERLAQYRVEVLEKTGLSSLEEIFDMIDRVDLRLAARAAKEARWR